MKNNNVPNIKILQTAAKKLKDAKPSSGFTPQTVEEWNQVQAAFVESGYSMLLHIGVSHDKAQSLTKALYGGQNGLTLLHLALQETDHE